MLYHRITFICEKNLIHGQEADQLFPEAGNWGMFFWKGLKRTGQDDGNIL